jgi:shikimate kinase
MNIYLVGYMGSGKSTVGKRLARLLNKEHLDLDDYFEEAYKISVINFFNKYDEAAFRKIETELLYQTESLTNHIISTGGGTPCFNQNMNWINAHGLSVYIQMHQRSLFDRLKHARRPRPRTSNLNDDELNERINTDMLVREPFYLQAHICTKGESIDIEKLAVEIAGRIALGSK